MKTKTIIPILLVIAALTLTSFALIPKQAHSLQGSYMYVSLSYGRGWMPWTCVVDQGLNARDLGWFGFGQYGCYSGGCTGVPKCNNMRGVSFESGALPGNYGVNTDVRYNFEPVCGILAQVTIPEDIKLITHDGYVIEDELCTGDKFKFSKGVEKGEWWGRGGHGDSPPIYWVDDVEKLVLDILDYHNKTTTTREDVRSNPKGVPDGYIDEVAGIPVYTLIMPSGHTYGMAKVTGNMVCSIKEKELYTLGATEIAGYYEAKGQDISFDAEFVVECMYYYFGSVVGDINYTNPFSCGYYTYQAPTIIQVGPYADELSAVYHTVEYNSIEDFFRVGTISFNKNIKVVQPVEEPELKIKTIITDNHIDHGETTYARLLITNNGATAVTLKSIESNVNHEFIYCDKETLEPGEQADCALTLTPDTETDITATVNFEYRRCGKRIESSKRQASSTITVQPLERCTKSADCEEGKVCCNRVCRTEAKGACDDFNGDGTFEWSYY